MIVVWSPQSCLLDEETQVYVLIEQALDAAVPTNHWNVQGPLRTQTIHPETFETLTTTWLYRTVYYESEALALTAWEEYDPNAEAPPPAEEPPPEDEPPQ